MDSVTSRRPTRKRDGVFQRDRRWWNRWTCSLGHDHCNPVGDTKSRALDEYHKRRDLVRRAREDGQHYCPRLQERRKKPVMFGELLDDFLRRKDLRARDEAERTLRRRKEAARVALLRARFGHVPVAAITARDVEAL